MSLSLVPILLLASAAGTNYHITVSGPDGEMDVRCTDPCHIEQVEIVGTAGGQTTSTTEANTDGFSEADRRGVECTGDCASRRSTSFSFNIQTTRKLREGVELRIDDGRAHFIFYDVVDAEAGPSTRRRHSEFDLDRALIVLDLHGNAVRIEVEGMDDGA
jgi:hypothetical protein